jgi:hypothetical protein
LASSRKAVEFGQRGLKNAMFLNVNCTHISLLCLLTKTSPYTTETQDGKPIGEPKTGFDFSQDLHMYRPVPAVIGKQVFQIQVQNIRNGQP